MSERQFYLLDNPPVRTQFYTSRNNPMTGGVGVHTTEQILDRILPDAGAENVCGFISRRTDAGSYVVVVDQDSEIQLVPDSYTTFSVATPGYNSRTWNIAIAARSADLDENDPTTHDLINKVGVEICRFWQRNGFDPVASARWIGADALSGAGLFNHGDVQPVDRSDAWARHPHRATFDQWLIEAIINEAQRSAPQSQLQTETNMIILTNEDKRKEMFHIFNGVPMACWQSVVGGPFGNWTPIAEGLPHKAVGLTGEVLTDGRLAITVATEAWGSLFGTWQPAPGAGPWAKWFNVNDLINYLNR